MTPLRAVKLAISNMLVDGLDDVLPTPMEIELLRTIPGVKEEIEKISLEKIRSFLSSNKPSHCAFDQLSLLPLSHVRVPKKEPFDFRKIAIIRPEDLAIYQAISIMIAEPFERARSEFARGRIFSYRFKPSVKKGRLFSSKHNIRSFQAATTQKTAQDSINYVVKCDIANFYDRVNIHRIESTLLTTKGLHQKLAELINQILLHWARRDSYGLPVGSNASRVLAEVAMFNVDQSLRYAKIDFIRFVDDFRIFTKQHQKLIRH